MHSHNLELTEKSFAKVSQEPSSNSLEDSTFVACLYNTSLSMEKFIFHLIGRYHGMIEVDSSTLLVSECTVVSEGSLSPFGISGGEGFRSSSISILFSKYSGSNERVMSLPPLTSLTLPSNQDTPHRDISMNTFDTSMNVVHGSGLTLSSIDLSLGTGTLFDFGMLSSLSPAVPSTTISLTHSSLRNVSSLASKTTSRLFRQARQILVSCDVEQSTNHFSGTATADVNICGSFLASNSSFSKCTSNLDESHEYPTYTLSHRTGTNTTTAPPGQPTQNVEITRCTFTQMTGSEKATAIAFDYTVGNIDIVECSFFDCNGTSYNGVVYVCPSSSSNSFTFSSCVVVRCKSDAMMGGVVIIFQPGPVAVSDCVFYKTETNSYGSSLTIINAQSGAVAQISNSIFESARWVNEYASSLCFTTSVNIYIDSLRFVDTKVDGAYDVFYDQCFFTINDVYVANCQSSRSELICKSTDYMGTTTHDGLFTPITQETFVKAFSGIDNEDGTATFTIEVGDAVTGNMVVVVENLDCTRSSPPPIPRSLTFDFGLGGTTASCTVAVGDTELIQSPVEKYTLRRAAVTDWLVPTLRVKSKTVSFTDETKTQIDISLECDGIVRSGNSILVKTGDTEQTLSLVLNADEETLTATGTISASTESVLNFGTTYTIVAVKDEWGRALIVPDAVSFTTPEEPPRLVGLKVAYLNSEKQIKLTWEGRLLKNGQYTVTLSVNGTSTTTLTPTFDADGATATTTETLYKTPSSALRYNTKYVVTEVTDISSQAVLFNSGITFTTIVEPTRLLSISSQVNGTDLNRTTLTLTGHQLPAESATLTVVLSSVVPGSETGSDKIVLPGSVTTSGDDSTVTALISLYPTSTLAFGQEYRVVSLSSAKYIDSTLLFTTPTEPTRLEGVTPVLSDDEKSLTLTFKGRVFDSGVYELTLQPDASNTDIVVDLTRHENGTLSCSISTNVSETSHVVFGAVYTIAQITKDNTPIIINPQAKQFTVPASPLLKSISFTFTNSPCTSFKLVLSAENVNTSDNYILKLASGKTLPVTFSTSQRGETTSYPIGWSDTFEYRTEYAVDELKAESLPHPMRKEVDTFTTFEKPPNITLFVDRTSTFDDRTCGDQTNPCVSIEKVWGIADGLRYDVIIVKILKETKETKPISIPDGVSVLIENGKVANGVVRIPADTTHPDGSGLITVNEGTLKLNKVEIAVESPSESFVFLCGVNSTIILENCVIDGVNIPVPNTDTLSICEWTSGVIQLDNCTTTLISTVFYELPQGALNLKNGTITVDGTIFRDNTPNHESFPSARRNILCTDEGEVRIGTLNGGDGTHDTPSAWMALGDCHLNSKSVDETKLLFIPTLDSNKTTSKSTKDVYEVSLFGSVLMPCGLGLEVVEWDEKEKVEKRSTTIDLAGLNSSEWKETSVNLTLNRSFIEDIDHSLEIHARLAFGLNQSKDNHFVLKISDVSAKKAHTLEQAKKILVWLIPVLVVIIAVIVVLIIVLILRRKRQRKGNQDGMTREMDHHDPIDVEKHDEPAAAVASMNADDTNHLIHHNVPTTIGSDAVAQKDYLDTMASLNSGGRGEANGKTKMGVRCEGPLIEVPVNVNNTLYNRLHKEGSPLNKPAVFRMITRGLAQIAKHNPKMPILTNLSPLWVYLDENDYLLFQSTNDSETVQANTAINASSLSQSLNDQSSNRQSEAQRWMAPEVADKKGEIDTTKAAVFSLGLILWEIETGLVPFGEIDAVNAQRQMGTGSLPLMDSWTNESKIELVRRCLTLNPKERPTLDEIASLLDSNVEFGEPAMEKQNVAES
ncbi:hypothetical protein BLNAU_18992 [Blattamonas nauphoetae]|uniref:Protein kinase domain-containing protein n=1 Tax=Blattamonas nauphoetae TaxID=2049346 RepID=A0ABQ9X2T9_9EUKA|nr:hypothetical protein BLNAU_18992 [Blattamonas nauphoetae]